MPFPPHYAQHLSTSRPAAVRAIKNKFDETHYSLILQLPLAPEYLNRPLAVYIDGNPNGILLIAKDPRRLPGIRFDKAYANEFIEIEIHAIPLPASLCHRTATASRPRAEGQVKRSNGQATRTEGQAKRPPNPLAKCGAK